MGSLEAEKDKKALICKEKGNKAFSSGNFDEALKHYTEAIQIVSSQPFWFKTGKVQAHVLHSNRSACFIALKEYKFALDAAERCIDAKKDWSKGYLRKGTALYYLGKLDKAIECLEEGLKLEPDNTEIQKKLETVKNVMQTKGGLRSSIAFKLPLDADVVESWGEFHEAPENLDSLLQPYSTNTSFVTEFKIHILPRLEVKGFFNLSLEQQQEELSKRYQRFTELEFARSVRKELYLSPTEIALVQKVTQEGYLPRRNEIAKAFNLRLPLASPTTPKKNNPETQAAWDHFREFCEAEMIREFLNVEYMEALAGYLESRHKELVKILKETTRIFHIGSPAIGNTLSKKFQALDIDYHVWTKEESAESYIRYYEPHIIVCVWMPAGSDWTAMFREIASVQEYILIGDPRFTGHYWKTWGRNTNAEKKERPGSPVSCSVMLPSHVLGGFLRNDLTSLSELQIGCTDDETKGNSQTVSFQRVFT